MKQSSANAKHNPKLPVLAFASSDRFESLDLSAPEGKSGSLIVIVTIIKSDRNNNKHGNNSSRRNTSTGFHNDKRNGVKTNAGT